LVESSKKALSLIKGTQQTGGITKESLFCFLDLPPEIKDHNREREAIFSALLSSELIHQKDSCPNLYIISDKGERFLKFIGR
jgi:hypothetical protein